MRWLAGWGHALLRFLLGVLFTHFPVGAFLLAGWGQEVLRRAALREWAGTNATPELRAWPSFTLAEPHEIREGGSRLRRGFRLLTGGLLRNARLALKGLFCTYCLTLPGVALWAFSWRYGWDNSFNKGYEQAFIGPTLGISGILLFIAAMFYVPLAQAQLAVCGNVASFFRWRVVRAVFMNNLHGVVWLALAYAIAALPINFLLAAVLFRFNESNDVAAIPDDQFRSVLDRYFFFAGMVALPLYAWVRVTAGRVYARGLRRAASTQATTLEADASLINGLASMERVLIEHVDVAGAVTRLGLGPVSFVWGEPGNPSRNYAGGYGVAHIVAKRNAEGHDGMDVARQMVTTIISGTMRREWGPDSAQRVEISHNNHVAILTKYWHGIQETWLLTGWKEGGPDASSGDYDPTGATDPRPTRSRSGSGAGPSTSILPDSGPGVNSHFDSPDVTMATAIAALSLKLPRNKGGFFRALRRTLLVPIALLLIVIWFAFVAQIYVRQFLNYVPLRGWVVQPLVHGPWLRYIPPHLNTDTDGKLYPNDTFPEPPY